MLEKTLQKMLSLVVVLMAQNGMAKPFKDLLTDYKLQMMMFEITSPFKDEHFQYLELHLPKENKDIENTKRNKLQFNQKLTLQQTEAIKKFIAKYLKGNIEQLFTETKKTGKLILTKDRQEFSYLIAVLSEREILTNTQYYKICESIIQDEQGNYITGMKNNAYNAKIRKSYQSIDSLLTAIDFKQ